MARVLITGMSGTGKTTVIEELRRRGFAAVETDTDDWSVPSPDGDLVWDEDRMAALLREHEESGEPLFVSGTRSNQGRFYPRTEGPRFTHVVLFTAPVAVMLERVGTRTNNPYGKSPEERAEILGYVETVEPLLRNGADLVVDTRAPLAEVVERVSALSTGLSTGYPQAGGDG